MHHNEERYKGSGANAINHCYICNFKLGELRQVHPHWDELCGQALNSAYYELTKRADKLLTECQRRVHSEPDLHDVLAILTSVQVHILNPVDVLRPAMDEGTFQRISHIMLCIFGVLMKNVLRAHVSHASLQQSVRSGSDLKK